MSVSSFETDFRDLPRGGFAPPCGCMEYVTQIHSDQCVLPAKHLRNVCETCVTHTVNTAKHPRNVCEMSAIRAYHQCDTRETSAKCLCNARLQWTHV
jgi:hypothetical protein